VYERKFTTINEYISESPENTREKLEIIRKVVKEVVPEAEETISYNMPAFRYHGILLYFAGFKGHIGFYPGDASTIALFKDQLKGFETSKGTIRFPLNQDLPIDLIRTIVQFRAAANLGKFRKKRINPNTSIPLWLTNKE
jgi:uncharacterized protein YdhG (YjbR/CyaY superfamily)